MEDVIGSLVGPCLGLLSGTLRVGIHVSGSTLGCTNCFMGTTGSPGTPRSPLGALENANGSIQGDSEAKHVMEEQGLACPLPVAPLPCFGDTGQGLCASQTHHPLPLYPREEQTFC